MDMNKASKVSPQPEQRVVRLSFGGLLLSLLGLLVLSVIGGLIGQRLVSSLGQIDPNNTSLTVEQVTISPNTRRVELVNTHQAAVLLLAESSPLGIVRTLGVAVVLSSDGVIVTPVDSSAANLVGLSADGRVLSLRKIGRDPVYGLAYYRTEEAVTPIDLSQAEAAVGQSLVALSRSPTTFEVKAQEYLVTEYRLPVEGSPVGVQRYLSSSSLLGALTIGSPLIGEDGRLAGIVISSEAGWALPASQLGDSFDRIASNKRERDLFAELGLGLRHSFTDPTLGREARFSVVVTQVRNGSVAARAGLRVNDRIVEIASEPLAWERSVLNQLDQAEPRVVTIERGASSLSLTLE